MQAFRIFSNCRGTEPPMCNQRCGQPAAGLGPVVSPVEERTLEPGRAPGELARGAQAPLVVRKGVAAFPAVAKWTFEFLAAAAETAATVEEIQVREWAAACCFVSSERTLRLPAACPAPCVRLSSQRLNRATRSDRDS